ncbi:trypsin-like serine protease [Dactylosporangium sp. CA-233914]|uniref:trypsin-like serine protease n=1 Tax=Dactylosporangium sp. CA-233914 TaxID=3239934 RepID=UPI003D902790
MRKPVRILVSLIGAATVAAGLMVAAGVASAGDGPVTPMLVGARPATEAYPIGHWNACTVILIKPDWALTAAHCTWRNGYVGIGTDRTKPVATSETVRRVFAPGSADVALLELSPPVTNVKPAPIARSTPPVGTRTRLVGFGQTCPEVDCGGFTNVAMELDTSIVADSRCPAIVNGAQELCTDNPGGNAGACYGDSGGPQFQKNSRGEWIVVGATSGSGTVNTACGVAPSIYVDVTDSGGLRGWIAQTVGGLPEPGDTSPPATTPPPTTPPVTTPPPTTPPATTPPPTTPPATTPPATSAWAPWTAYRTGQTVTYGGVSYTCVQGHTSLPGWEPPVVPALWRRA